MTCISSGRHSSGSQDVLNWVLEIREMVSLALESNLPILPKGRPSKNKNQLNRDWALPELVNRFINHKCLPCARCGSRWSKAGDSLNAVHEEPRSLYKWNLSLSLSLPFSLSLSLSLSRSFFSLDRSFKTKGTPLISSFVSSVMDYQSFCNCYTHTTHLRVTENVKLSV